MRIVCLFNLKPGVAPDEYEGWAREIDLPGVDPPPSVDRLTVHRATGLFGSNAKPPYGYVEVIDVRGMEPFVADVSNREFQRVAARFGEFADNPVPAMSRTRHGAKRWWTKPLSGSGGWTSSSTIPRSASG